MKEIKCVIMDWAGTAVDYGCFAPLKAFLKVFKEEKGIEISNGYGDLKEKTFRISHMADMTMDDMKEVTSAIEEVLGL